MRVYEKIREQAERYSSVLLIALPAAIMLLYLGCWHYRDLGDVINYFSPALIKSAMILSLYLAWRCYRKENVPVIVSILLCGIAAALPLVREKHWVGVGGEYWCGVAFLCAPVILLFVIRTAEKYIAENRAYYIWKRSLLYFLTVLIMLYFITNAGLYYAVGSLKYFIADGFYLLLLADILFWKILYGKPEQADSRIKAAVLMAVMNVGVLIFYLIENPRLQEVLSYVGRFLVGGRWTASQPDWIGYRKAALEAFWSKDLTVLDQTLKKEKYQYSLFGRGLAHIRFQCGLLPVLGMILLLILLIIFLWNWKRGNTLLHQCACCLAVSYILRMCIVLVLQANMIVSPYMEFPFTGDDMGEIMLLVLLVYEGSRRKAA